MPRTYVHHRVVRFGECDPFGYVYTPRFFDWFHEAMEAWFEDDLGLAYAEYLRDHGLPTAATEARFSRPCLFGDAVEVRLSVEQVGRRSLKLRYVVHGADGEERAEAHTVCATVARATGRAVPFPPDLRARIEAWLGRS